MNFQTFCDQKYNMPPYDLSHNIYGFNRNRGSDISAHLPLLEFLAKQCNHITEFGTRECYSTCAFIRGCSGIVISYDITYTPDIKTLQTLDKPCKWQFHIQDTIDTEFSIHQTDLLFIDTEHTYQQVKNELELHGNKANKYIVFHDTYSFSEIQPAIHSFLNNNPQWKIVYKVNFNHGLMVIQK